jgi:hypothetical protein
VSPRSHDSAAARDVGVRSAPRNNPEIRGPKTAVRECESKDPLHSKGSRRTPGGTRIPNLLIRRQALIIESVTTQIALPGSD